MFKVALVLVLAAACAAPVFAQESPRAERRREIIEKLRKRLAELEKRVDDRAEKGEKPRKGEFRKRVREGRKDRFMKGMDRRKHRFEKRSERRQSRR